MRWGKKVRAMNCLLKSLNHIFAFKKQLSDMQNSNAPEVEFPGRGKSAHSSEEEEKKKDNQIFVNGAKINDISEHITFDGYDIHFYGGGNGNDLYLNPIKGLGKVWISVWGCNNTFKFGVNNIVNCQMSINFWGVTDKMPVRTLVEIGNENYFNGEKFQIICPVEENRKIHIGDSNLFANNVLFRGRNDHAVFDLKSLNRLNEDTDLILGNKNWVCENVLFLPRSNVLNGCVISERTLINPGFHVAKSVKLENLDKTPTLGEITGVLNQYYMNLQPQ